MRKSLKVFSCIAIAVAVVLIFAWPYITMEFAGSAHYTEQDKREYNFYTPDILKKMPRITPRYDFDFANITGPASHIYAVRYYDTDDSSKVDAYLNSIGYRKQDDCHIEAVCWRKTDPQEIVTVSTLNNPKALLVSVIYNF
ncbi:hypothetical protein Z042_10840 [Chania multitudinisentens RB-25]|uniref:Uncharacterized protein n=1 Tax=Chania multitudinisentens RB-25 TaxID=1441930 RepID=W0LCD9_9GAMM|nr:hypothetical protein [Chania multitudinisentens]AHG20069.1 hypothetical protein Z042_10840 [Chania multitudinisentens RB-25]